MPPVFFGLLAESHEWKAPASTPKENIRDITDELERDMVQAPREGLDLLCVPDLGTWDRITMVLPEKFLKQQLTTNPLFGVLTHAYGTDSLVMSSMRHDYEQQDLSPLTHFIGLLRQKLALNDASLKPLADGFRITKTSPEIGSFNMGSGPYKLASVSTEQIAARYRFNDPWSY